MPADDAAVLAKTAPPGLISSTIYTWCGGDSWLAELSAAA